MGDAHLSQGDSELDGTASEVSINAKVHSSTVQNSMTVFFAEGGVMAAATSL
jgi:acetamidase/formamidase